MRPLNILVVDDELALRQITADTIARHGHTVETAGGGNEALEKLKVGEFDICLSDIRMPDLSGLELIERAKALKIETSFLMMTAYASVTTAIEAMKLGAYDYMVKPIRHEDLLNRLGQLSDIIGLRSENETLRNLVMAAGDNHCPSQAPAMQHLDRLTKKVAVTDSTVMITGESGTGKGVTARNIHKNSLRANAPSFQSTAGPFLKTFWKVSFLDTPKARLPVPLKLRRVYS